MEKKNVDDFVKKFFDFMKERGWKDFNDKFSYDAYSVIKKNNWYIAYLNWYVQGDKLVFFYKDKGRLRYPREASLVKEKFEIKGDNQYGKTDSV